MVKKLAKISFPTYPRQGDLIVIPIYQWTCRICQQAECSFPCPFLTKKGFFDWNAYWDWWLKSTPSYIWPKFL
ncbi:MAG: hypothetical protein MRERV_3c082 [Mycoplasmataceae bacterium RV_VA103A]|nr:MAG: hypothetical protein MRERV_3c082 [Mycoplasmataceae bacterium RV_VA103A]